MPRETAELFGQEEAEHELAAAWAAGRLHHAWLLTGPRGVGKATLAHRFARFLLAQGEPAGHDDPAGSRPLLDLAVPEHHPVFRRTRSGGHSGHFTLHSGAAAEREAAILDKGGDRGAKRTAKVRPSEEIRVDDVRALIEYLHLTAGEGGWRIAVVDSVDAMTRNAANAFLKVLEEPPRNALLLVVSHAPGRLLPTIRSRCRRLALRPLPDATVAMLLARAAPDLPASESATLVRLAEGSAGRALRLLEEGGAKLETELRALLADLPRLDLPAVQALADRFAARREDAHRVGTLTELLDDWLAAIIRLRASSDVAAGVAGGNPPEPELLRVAQRAPVTAWLAARDRIAHIFERMESVNLDRRTTLVAAFSLLAETAGRA